MGFDVNKFTSTQFQPRMAEVEVPALADFFGKDEKPLWKVRGLTGHEVAQSNEAEQKAQRLRTAVTALESVSKADQLKGFKNALGLSDNTPADLAKRLELLVMGSVEPEITLDVAVKVATVAPVEFFLLTTEILKLTGLGQEAEKKQTASGKKAK